ncbi:MAG TPA: 2Fe-2S iron-sulfur cluster-binding protein [Acidimicrobiales bacterium]|nr:2Fe-2S iron-sulfur cluster-binding protein [Acidimicrobiales bacterium]
MTVDGVAVDFDDNGGTLLDALREQLGIRSVKDGCSPQGQCGCCTVLVDGRPRVACVTPLRRVADREVTTVEGLEPDRRQALVDAVVSAGASQCGFCTPGIICRLAALPSVATEADVETALLAHLCRCTGWRSVVDAAVGASASGPGSVARAASREGATARATLEGGTPQQVGPSVVLGGGGFAADTAPPDALVAVPAPGAPGGWVVAATLAGARAAAGKVQGRRSGGAVRPPLDLPPGDWAVVLATSWVEPGYLEPDASWCAPGGTPASPLANGGAFGAKAASPLPAVARRLADEHGAPVLAMWSREDVVRLGPKRPPMAAGVRADGSGVVRVVRTPGIAAAIASVAPDLAVEEVDVAGPPTSAAIRAAGWAEAAVLLAGAAAARRVGGGTAGAPRTGTARVTDPRSGGRADATVHLGAAPRIHVAVDSGDPLDEVVLRSYVTGAAHMALGWVTSEGLSVGDDGVPDDLTVRSWGVLRARDTPHVTVEITGAGRPPVAVSDAAFAAVAAATWLALGLPPAWPTTRVAWEHSRL